MASLVGLDEQNVTVFSVLSRQISALEKKLLIIILISQYKRLEKKVKILENTIDDLDNRVDAIFLRSGKEAKFILLLKCKLK